MPYNFESISFVEYGIVLHVWNFCSLDESSSITHALRLLELMESGCDET
jgi:hypothetical protein